MPGKDRPPSFQFYPRDLLSSASYACMTPEARGGYLSLLCHAWLQPRQGWLPGDDETLAALSGLNGRWHECKPMIAKAFEVHGMFWVQARMVRARAEQESFSKLQQAKAHARWAKYKQNMASTGIAPAMPEVCSASASASASALESKEESTPPPQSLRSGKPTSGRVPAEGSPALTTNTGAEWRPTQQEIDAWSKAYPGLDVVGTLVEAQAWLVANPTRRKTFNGMARFVNGWLAREQNRL